MAINKNLRLPTVMEVTGYGRTTIYRLMAEGKFPKSIKIGARAVAWRQSDIENYLDSVGVKNECHIN